jgi:hypothetical protein
MPSAIRLPFQIRSAKPAAFTVPFRVLVEKLLAAHGAKVIRQAFVLALIRRLIRHAFGTPRIIEPKATHRIPGHDRIPPCCRRLKIFPCFPSLIGDGKILAVSGSEKGTIANHTDRETLSARTEVFM